MTSFRNHYHIYTGVKVTVEIILSPPFVIVTPEPLYGITETTDDNRFLDHGHDLLDPIPSVDISYSGQQQIGRYFMSHSHTMESGGISLIPPGVFTSVVSFLPPPIDFLNGPKRNEIFNSYLNSYHRMLSLGSPSLDQWRSMLGKFAKKFG